jgi:hypothetical protein
MVRDAVAVASDRGAVASSTVGFGKTAGAPEFQPDGDHRDANHDHDRRE